MSKKKKDNSEKPAADHVALFPTKGSTTKHSIDLSGGTVRFHAVSEWISLRKVHKPVAQVFHTAYLVGEGETDRPLTFVFNGGPGAASAYLHMGALGPKRVAFGERGSLPQPPTRVVDNLETWLDFTDLVFIDPIGTGFSRALTDEKKKDEKEKGDGGDASGDPKENPEFWEVERDLDSLGEFISRFLSKHHRWTSPLFIAGESYGGFRVAKMARRLQEDHGVGLCGAMLISPAIELESLWGSDYDVNYWLELFPSLVASAHHHRRTQDLPAETPLAEVVRQAEAFAQNELARLLVQGEAFPADERAAILQRMSNLMGLPTAELDRASARISSTRFCRELLRDERRLCGHYDASVTTVDPFPDRHDYDGPDPTLYSIDRLFTSAINHQLRTNLKVDTDLGYRLLSMQVNESWTDESKTHFFSKLTGAMDDLRYGMSLNEHMKVFISHGYFDLITPYFSSGRLIGLMKLTEAQRRNLTTRNYPGGHMFYSWDESRVALHDDSREFFAAAMETNA